MNEKNFEIVWPASTDQPPVPVTDAIAEKSAASRMYDGTIGPFIEKPGTALLLIVGTVAAGRFIRKKFIERPSVPTNEQAQLSSDS